MAKKKKTESLIKYGDYKNLRDQANGDVLSYSDFKANQERIKAEQLKEQQDLMRRQDLIRMNHEKHDAFLAQQSAIQDRLNVPFTGSPYDVARSLARNQKSGFGTQLTPKQEERVNRLLNIQRPWEKAQANENALINTANRMGELASKYNKLTKPIRTQAEAQDNMNRFLNDVSAMGKIQQKPQGTNTQGTALTGRANTEKQRPQKTGINALETEDVPDFQPRKKQSGLNVPFNEASAAQNADKFEQIRKRKDYEDLMTYLKAGAATGRLAAAEENLGGWLSPATEEYKEAMKYVNAAGDIETMEQARKLGLTNGSGDISAMNRKGRNQLRRDLEAQTKIMKGMQAENLDKLIADYSQIYNMTDEEFERKFGDRYGKWLLDNEISEQDYPIEFYRGQIFDEYQQKLDELQKQKETNQKQIEINEGKLKEIERYNTMDDEYADLMNPAAKIAGLQNEIRDLQQEMRYQQQTINGHDQLRNFAAARDARDKYNEMEARLADKQEELARWQRMDSAGGDAEYHSEYYKGMPDKYIGEVAYYGKGETSLDRIYSFINGGEEYRARFGSDLGKEITQEYRGAMTMLPEEKEKFTELYNKAMTEGREPTEAKAFLDALQPYLNQRYRTYEELQNRRFGRVMPITSSIASVAGTIAAPFQAAATAIGSKAGAQWAQDPFSQHFFNARYQSDVEGQIASDLGPVGGMIYKGAMSGLKNAVRGLESMGFGGAAAGVNLGLFFGENYYNTYQQKLEETGDPKATGAYALVDSIISTLFEVASVEAMFSDSKSMWEAFAKNVIAETSEEFNEGVLGPYIHKVLDGSHEWEKQAEQILDAGGYEDANGNWVKVDSWRDAWKQACRDWNNDLFERMVVASISSGGSSLVSDANISLNDTKTGEFVLNKNRTKGMNSRQLAGLHYDNTIDFINAAAAIGENTQSGKAAADLNKDIANGKEISARKLGRLVRLVSYESSSEIAKIAQDTLSERFMKRLKDSGSSQKEAADLSRILVNAVVNDRIGFKDVQTLARNEEANKILEEYRTSDEKKTFDEQTKAAREAQSSVMEVLAAPEDTKKTETMVEKSMAGATTAARADVISAGKSSGSALEVLGGGALADVVSIRRVEEEVEDEENNKKKKKEFRLKVTLSDGRELDIADLKAVQGKTAQVLKFLQNDRGETIGENLANTLVKVTADKKADPVKTVGDAIRMMFAQATGQRNVRTSLDAETENEIRTAITKDLDAAKKDRLSRFREIKPGKSRVVFNGYEYGSSGFNAELNGLDRQTQNEARITASIARSAGVDVEFYYDEKDAGNQGSFVSGTADGGIRVNLAGEYNNEGAHRSAVATFAHETTHWLEANSPDAYESLRNFIFTNLKNSGFDLESELRRVITSYRNHGENLDLNGAIAEIVAKGCEQVLTNEELVTKLKEQDPTTYGKVKNAVVKLIGRIRNALGGMRDTSSMYAKALMGVNDELSRLWYGAYEEAKDAKGTATGEGNVQASQMEGEEKHRRQTINIKDAVKNPKKYQNYFKYDSLTRKDPIKAITLHQIDDTKSSEQIIASGMENAEQVGKKVGNNVFVHVYDIGADVQISKRGLGHGLDNRMRENQAITERIGEVIQEAVLINTAYGRSPGQGGHYMLLGAATNSNGNGVTYALIQVNRITNRVENLDVIDAVRSTGADWINNKKTAGTKPQVSAESLPRTVSYIKISDALDAVKDHFDDVLPISVMKHYNMQRRYSKDEDLIQHSFREDETEGTRLESEHRAAYERMTELRNRQRELKNEFKDFEQRIMNATEDEQEGLMQEALEWQEKSGFNQLTNELKEAEEAEKNARKALDKYIEQRDVAEEQEKIKQSGLTEADWRRKEAVKEYGYTGDFREAGYMLPNGKMLNFTGEKGKHYGHRGQDHRNISTLYASETMSGAAAMNAFMNDGNIRVMAESPGVDISTAHEPTKEQYSQIRNMASRFADEEYFNVDLSDENGSNIGSLEYEGRINPTRIVNDIKHYFQTGEIREQSAADKFRYSFQEDEDYAAAVKRGDMQTAQRMVDEAAKAAGYTPVVRYHQTGERFTVFNTDNPVAGATDSQTPNGIFFKTNDHDIGVGADYVNTGHGGKIQMPVYLKTENMLHFRDRNQAAAWYKKNVPGYQELSDEWDQIYAEQFKPKFDAIDAEMFNPKTTDERYQELEKQEEELIEQLGEVERAHLRKMRETLNQYFLKGKSKYDGIELDNDGHRYIDGKREDVHTFIVFSPTQIKSADAATYDDNGKLIPLSERFNETEKDIRYSFSEESLAELDDQYEEAYNEYDDERGEQLVAEMAERAFPDSKVRDENGKLKVVYHQTNADPFTVFDMDKARQNEDIVGAFFAPEFDQYHEYGERTYAVYLNIKNPAYDEFSFDKSTEGAGLKRRNELIEQGYDGVINTEDGKPFEYIAFYPEQIKSAEAFTEDDDGNLIPLSQRMNTWEQDIRYSFQDEMDMDVRGWMETVNEASLQTEAEKQLLRNFKSVQMRARLKAEQERKIRDEIRGLENVLAGNAENGGARLETMQNALEALGMRIVHTKNGQLLSYNGTVVGRTGGNWIGFTNGVPAGIRNQLEANGFTYNKVTNSWSYTNTNRTTMGETQIRQKMKGLQDRLEKATREKEQAQDELAKITGSEGYAGMMYRQQRRFNDFQYGKTQSEVRDEIEKLESSAQQIARRIAENQEALGRLEKDAGVQRVKNMLGQTTADRIAGDLKKQYASTWTKGQIRTYLDPILLKMSAGQEFMDDVRQLAEILVNSDSRNTYEELSALRGLTITLGKGAQAELKAQRSSLKEVRARLAGTGITVKYGDRSTLESDIEDLRAEYPNMPDMGDEKNALGNFLDWIDGMKQASASNEFYDQKLAEAIATVTGLSAAAADDIYLPADPRARDQVLELVEYVKALGAETKASQQALADVAKELEKLQAAGRRASGMANSLTHDLNVTIDYYNRMARIAEDTAKQKTRKDIVEQLKSEHAQKIAKNNEEWRNLIERDAKARAQAEDNRSYRGQINTVVKRVYNLLKNPKNDKNVSEHMQGAARMLLDYIIGNDTAGTGLKLSMISKKDLMEARRVLDAWTARDGAPDLSGINDAESEDVTLHIINQDLMAIEEGIRAYNGDIRGKNKLETLQQRGEILRQIQEAASEIYSAIRAEGQVQMNRRKVAVADAAYKVWQKAGGKRFREWTGRAGRALAGMHKAIVSGNMTPEYFFRTLGNEGLSDLWDNYHDAENRNGLELAKAKARMDSIAAEHGYNTWDMQKKYTVELGSGKIEMTLGQLMSLWATWNREQALGPEMSQHLTKGGFYVEQDMREGLLGRTTVEKKAHRVDEADMARIAGMLTDEQKAYVNDVVQFMSNDMSKLGNEASMAAYGIKLYKEGYYFPFQMWDGIKSRKSNDAAQGANIDRAFHPSFSKSRIHGANNALVIGDFARTAADHIAGMINYATMGLANESLQKVLNYTVEEGNSDLDSTKRNIRAILQEAYGQEAMQYLDKLQLQLNGGAVKVEKTFYDKLISLFRKNAVAGSLSVALQQPLSYIRASMMVNPKYLAAALNPATWRGSYAEMMAHSGVAVIKDMGRFDMNFGQSAREYLMPDSKEKTAKRIWKGIEEYSTILPELMDRMTWTRMWSACKAEMKAQHPEMDPTSDEFLDMVGERFNDVMRRTQVYDSVLVKSQNMRSENQMIKSLTSFMAEPTLTLNVLADAVRSAKAGEKGGMGLVGKAGATFLLSAVLQAAVKGIMGSGRTPDEKKTWLENFMYRFEYNFLNEADPLQLIPGFSDLVTVLKGGELKDDAYGTLKKMQNAGQGLIDVIVGNKDFNYRNVEDSAAQLVQLFSGVPLKNIMRDGRAMWNWTIDQPYAERETSKAVLGAQAEDLFWNADNLFGIVNKWMGEAGFNTDNKGYYQRIYNAKKSGDEEAAQNMIEYLLSGKGVKEETISKNMTSIAKKDEDASAEETASFLIGEGTNAQDYIRDQLKEGNISAEDARKLMQENNPDKDADSIWWTVDRIEWAQDKGLDEVPSGNYYRLWDAMDNNSANEIRDAVQTMTKHGVEAKNIKTQISSHYKKAYLAADSNGKRRIRDAIQKTYKTLGFTAEDADKIINKWK